MIARSSFSESRQPGIRCAESCDYLNDRTEEIGFLWLDRSQCCSARTDSPGARVLPGKTSRVLERKSETAARLLEFSKSDTSLDTIRTCPLEVTIRIIKSLRKTFGAMTRVRRITIVTSCAIRRIRLTITITK